MKYSLLFSFLFLITITAFSQSPREQQDQNSTVNLEFKVSRIFGKLVDQNGKPIEAASVLLHFAKHTDSLLQGVFTKQNGDFSFTKFPPDTNGFLITISAVGYEPEQKAVTMTRPDVDSTRFERDLGNIALTPEVKKLSNVIVTVTKPALQLGVDRKIFSVDKSLTSTGGTAVDVMKNIPSVSVDVNGNVQLRNNTPQIFIDGRPTILTLDQIPADHIDKVELITNPSAKYDASSSGGIINIVLKKDKRVGMNGLATIGGGSPSVFSTNLNINMRQGKFNVFASGGFNRSGGEAKSETNRQNKDNGIITDYFNQSSFNHRSRRFYSIRFGTDYFIDNRNTLTVTQGFVNGKFGNDEFQHQDYLDAAKTLTYHGERESNDKAGFNRKSSRLNFKHSFPKEGKEFTADVNYNYGGNNSDANISNDYVKPDGSIYQPSSFVRNDGDNKNTQLTIQADYSNPITDRSKIETGVRSYHNHSGNLYNVYSIDNGVETKLPLSNHYQYDEMVNAGYVTYSNKNKKQTFSYQFGLRAEYSKFDGRLIDSSFKFGYQYPDQLKNIWNSIFPSFFVSQKITDDDELQFNYTRRIRRPRFWELDPFVDISDPLNLQQGNPLLKPEFINSFEFNYSKNYHNGNFLATLYFVNNPKDITEYSDTLTTAQYQTLNNAAVDPNAILNTYINANTTNRYGVELTLQHKIGDKFDITPTLNGQYRTTRVDVNNLPLSNSGFNWSAKLMTDYKIQTKSPSLFNNLSFQLSGEYQSPLIIPQGKDIAEYDADFAVKKEFMKNKKASLTFAVNDIFNSRRWGNIYDTESFYQYSFNRWNVRNFRLSFSYKFGDANFSLGKKSPPQHENSDE